MNSLESILTNCASTLKNDGNPRLVAPNYTKKYLKDDLPNAKLLTEKEYNDVLDVINTNIKEAKKIPAYQINLIDLLDEVNEILTTKVTEHIIVTRLEGDSKKTEFAKNGLAIHKPGEICAFCGSIIDDSVYEELTSYFSAGEVKKLNNRLNTIIDKIEEYKITLTENKMDSTLFYPQYKEESVNIENEFLRIRDEYISFLTKLYSKAELKRKDLFSSFDEIVMQLPTNISETIIKYNKLVEINNDNDFEKMISDAKVKMKNHKIKEYLDKTDYTSLNAASNSLTSEISIIDQRINKELSNKIEINKTIDNYNTEIKELRGQTISEEKLVEDINNKLLTKTSFKLKYIKNEMEGYYKIESLVDGTIRSINQLSTGEKI